MKNRTPKAILIQGGWDGHEPQLFAEAYRKALTERGYDVEVVDTLEVLDDLDHLKQADLISPFWTMGQPTDEQIKHLSEAVKAGTGLAGIHGGMGDAFRGKTEYEWMVGGHFVGHPHVGSYAVELSATTNPIVKDLPQTFDYDSEQYYMLIDPAIDALAFTHYTHEGKTCTMPVIWTKSWGKGRVFYSAFGHSITELETYPDVFEMSLRGIEWATRSN
jgi:type 1 glutamine amidotransferase